jgi:hypothetical protein
MLMSLDLQEAAILGKINLGSSLLFCVVGASYIYDSFFLE